MIDSFVVVNALDDFRHAGKVLITPDGKNAISGHFSSLLSGGSVGTLSHRRLTEKRLSVMEHSTGCSQSRTEQKRSFSGWAVRAVEGMTIAGQQRVLVRLFPILPGDYRLRRQSGLAQHPRAPPQ